MLPCPSRIGNVAENDWNNLKIPITQGNRRVGLTCPIGHVPFHAGTLDIRIGKTDWKLTEISVSETEQKLDIRTIFWAAIRPTQIGRAHV